MNKEKPDPIISETLDVIRKALESENHDNIFEKSKNDDILLLNKVVQDDGTIQTIKDDNIINQEVSEKNIEKVLNKHFKKWLDNNLPDILNKYIKNKN